MSQKYHKIALAGHKEVILSELNSTKLPALIILPTAREFWKGFDLKDWCYRHFDISENEQVSSGFFIDSQGPGFQGESALRVDWKAYEKLWQNPELRKKDLLLKAIKQRQGKVVDATCGLGKDSSLLACSGHEVMAFEKDPRVFLLLHSESFYSFRERYQIKLFHQSIFDADEAADVLYFDPMFEKDSKKSLPKKGMQLFQKILDPPEKYSGDHLKLLLSRAPKVIVKRAMKANPLFENPVNHQIKGKTVRFDVYL